MALPVASPRAAEPDTGSRMDHPSAPSSAEGRRPGRRSIQSPGEHVFVGIYDMTKPVHRR